MYKIDDYDFDLPEGNIAQIPSPVRDGSRLLCLDRISGSLIHNKFHDLVSFLKPSDIIVLNNTKVVPARLLGRKDTGGRVEILIIDYAGGIETIKTRGYFQCSCLVKASKAPKKRTRLIFDHGLEGEIQGRQDSVFDIRFHCPGDFESILEKTGIVPLPPYIKRDLSRVSPIDDRDTYQTIYASSKGAVAAPTAGLHFTKAMLDTIKQTGVSIAQITLHVGYGTFLPVRVEDIRDHKMHSERFFISNESADAVNTARQNGGRVIAVGTTTVRTLEYAVDGNGNVRAGSGACDLFIYPGYKFKIVQGMVTNFHLPKSTLLMLVSAFAGRENILGAYKEAIKENYRFYSYGDAMFIDSGQNPEAFQRRVLPE